MDTSPAPSSQAGQTKTATNEPTIEEIRSWDRKKLLLWILQKLSIEPEDEEKFSNAKINGKVFSNHAGDREFFMSAGLPLGVSDELADLARETSNKSKSCRSTSYNLHRQP